MIFSFAPDYEYYKGDHLLVCVSYGSIFIVSSISCRAFKIPYYIGMLAPFIVLYVFNWVIFIIISGSLIYRGSKKSKLSSVKKSSDNTRQFIRQQLVIIVMLSVLFGLGWGIGLFATNDIHSNKTVRDVVAAIFVLATSFHGLLIFIMHCLRSKDVRHEWKKWFRRATGKNVLDFTSSTSAAKAYRPGQAAAQTTATNLPTLQRFIPTSPFSDSSTPSTKETYFNNDSLSRNDSCEFSTFGHMEKSPEHTTFSPLEKDIRKKSVTHTECDFELSAMEDCGDKAHLACASEHASDDKEEVKDAKL